VFEPGDPACKVGTDPGCQDRTGFIALIGLGSQHQGNVLRGDVPDLAVDAPARTKPSWKATA
jgi:hypothetical protein